VQNLLKTQPKNFFPDGIKQTCKTLEPVRWSRGGLHWKVILVSFLYIYNKCAFFKSLFTFWLTLVKTSHERSWNSLYFSGNSWSYDIIVCVTCENVISQIKFTIEKQQNEATETIRRKQSISSAMDWQVLFSWA
jgi:predicted membrane metal-binding protein